MATAFVRPASLGASVGAERVVLAVRRHSPIFYSGLAPELGANAEVSAGGAANTEMLSVLGTPDHRRLIAFLTLARSTGCKAAMTQPADVVVAGSGAVGSTIALYLARAGLQVVVADPAPQGANASGVAAGMLAPA